MVEKNRVRERTRTKKSIPGGSKMTVRSEILTQAGKGKQAYDPGMFGGIPFIYKRASGKASLSLAIKA